jgi:hypothetical protein
LQTAGNKKHLWAVVTFLTIPAILMAGGALFSAIDPERLAGHADYVRNYRLLALTRSVVMWAVLGLTVAAWLVTCLLVLRSKSRTYWWLPLALLGPVGFAVLASLHDLGPGLSDLYERFNRTLNGFRRVAYETCIFMVALTLAWQLMVVKREAMISYESATIGVARDQIIDQQNAESGMWAFKEGNEVMYFLVVIYLLRPVCVNAAGYILGRRGLSGRT